MRLPATMFRGIAVLAIAATVAAPTSVWAEEGGRGGHGGGEIEVRHADDVSPAQVNEDRGADDVMAAPAPAPAPAAVPAAPATAPAAAPTAASATAPAAAPSAAPTTAPAAAPAAPAAAVTGPATAAAPSAAVALSIVEGAGPQDWGFAPAQLSTTVGTTLTWTNTGANDHTVTADDRTTFDSHGLAPSATFSFTPTTAGTFGYHCAFHPFMKGAITVT